MFMVFSSSRLSTKSLGIQAYPFQSRFQSGHIDTMNMKDSYQLLIPTTELHFL
ncbi:hypothetical protein Golax_000365, partial [Gossypium laxum]|nr:hypothetical protein [Gossypium laxum]